MNNLFYNTDILNTIVKDYQIYFGFDKIEEFPVVECQQHLYRTYNVYFKKTLEMKHSEINGVQDSIKEVFTPIYEAFERSQWHSDVKKKHEQEVNILKNKIKELEEQNMKLSEAFTNGLEYLEVEDDS
jgi:anthranilate/para-aminobenzoate synthase component II